MLPYWLPGALAAVALLALQLTRRHYLNAPAVLVSSVGAFWLVAWLAGAPATELRADRDSSAFRITKDALERMRHEDSSLAVAFHEFMVRTAAERLAHNTGLLEARLQ